MSAYRRRSGKGAWSSIQKQKLAQLQYGYGAITLRREAEQTIVEIEFNGKIYTIIKEELDSNFCHTVEPLEIASVIKGKELA